jgi:Peptidase family S41
MPPSLMGETAAAAMTFLGSTDALIVDLRQNGGGTPDGVALMASYLFEQPVRLNDIYDRPSNDTRQYWTLPYVPGPRFVGKDVYILTSNRTFSGAEDFTYGVKNQKRAMVVGEVPAEAPIPSARTVSTIISSWPCPWDGRSARLRIRIGKAWGSSRTSRFLRRKCRAKRISYERQKWFSRAPHVTNASCQKCIVGASVTGS